LDRAYSFVAKMESGERPLNGLAFFEYVNALGADAVEIIRAGEPFSALEAVQAGAPMRSDAYAGQTVKPVRYIGNARTGRRVAEYELSTLRKLEIKPVWRSSEILNVLDNCARDFFFPMLDNGYIYLAATRLSLFRSQVDWAMTIEVFGYSPRAGLPDTTIYTFGSHVLRQRREADFVTAEAFATYLRVHPHDESSIVFPIEPGEWQDSEMDELIAVEKGPVVLRGETLSMPERVEYPRYGITLTSPSDVHVFELCRFLAAIRRDQVLATSQERRACMSNELQQILQLEEWQHPDLVRSALPSSTETFQQLADVLVTGEPSRFRPMTQPNTHWQNWPDGGTL
jgi:hypothetical protein